MSFFTRKVFISVNFSVVSDKQEMRKIFLVQKPQIIVNHLRKQKREYLIHT